jgi:hypothetical protein
MTSSNGIQSISLKELEKVSGGCMSYSKNGSYAEGTGDYVDIQTDGTSTSVTSTSNNFADPMMPDPMEIETNVTP